MKVTLLQDHVGRHAAGNEGDILDLPEAVARNLIGYGIAKPAEPLEET